MGKVQPLASLNPHQMSWTVKVQVTQKGMLRTYRGANGEGCVFNVELTDGDGTQIKATMFNDVARKFFDTFQLGKVYHVSNGTIKVSPKKFRTVNNEYEMTLSKYSRVELTDEASVVPGNIFRFVPINQLGAYVDKEQYVDVIGIVQHVAPTTSIKRKKDNICVPKRDVTIVDETKKSVIVSLWNENATDLGVELSDLAAQFPVLAMKSLRVSDFQGVSLSMITSTYIQVNPNIEEAHKLRSWYDREGRNIAFSSTRTGLNFTMRSRRELMFKDRVTLKHIASNPSLGEERPIFFSLYACMTYVKPDKMMSYRACNVCLKKVTEAVGSGYWCENCKKNEDQCNRRYVLSVEFSDVSGAAQLSMFNDEAEKLIGCSADELEKMKSMDDGRNFQLQLQKAMWVPYLLRVAVAPTEYRNERRQRITVKDITPVDFAAEARLLLQNICVMKD